MKTLVLYYTRTGRTQYLAQAMAEVLAADCEPLNDTQDYSGLWGFLSGGRDALRGKVATLKPVQAVMARYDLIVIGQPVWAAQPVPAVRALLDTTDAFAHKPVALFVTYDGSGDQACLDRTAALLPRARIIARKSFLRVGRHPAENESRARAWAHELPALISASAPAGSPVAEIPLKI